MAIYTTFFLCKPDALPGGFPGWRLPLPQPVRREYRNPFTEEIVLIESREPEWPEGSGEELEREYQVVAIEGRYEDYLEGRLPPFVRACPYWATKGVTQIELLELIKVVGVEGSLECPIYGPPSVGAFVEQLPPQLLIELGSRDQQQIARQWAAAMSTPDHTHSVSGEKLYDGLTTSEALDKLQPLVTLACKATGDQQLYLLTEM
jgi:hypothetical protein